MPERAIQSITTELPKAGVLVGGLNAPAIINYQWLTTHTFLNITWDVWMVILSAILTFHVLGFFRGIRWLYRKATGYKSAEA